MSRLAGTAVAQRELTPFEKFRHQINLLRPDVAKMIGAEKVDKFLRVCLNAVQRSGEEMLAADRRSLLLACMEAAQDGLNPDGTEAVFNVYKTKIKRGNVEEWVPVVQYLPMAYGLIQLMFEIPGVTGVDAAAVYEKEMEAFEYERGDNPHIKHIPWSGLDDPGKVAAAYIVVKFKDRETKRELMFRRDIEKVRKKSKAPTGLMWKEGEDGFYDQGAIKSVIHRVFKQLPQAERLRRTLAHDNKSIGLVDVEVKDDAVGTDLAALVDGRLATELRDGALPTIPNTVTGTEKFVEGVTVEADGAKKADAAGGATGVLDAALGAATGTATPPAKKGDPGTPEKKAAILKNIAASTARDYLDIMADEIRFYTWGKGDLDELNVAYATKKDELDAAAKA